MIHGGCWQKEIADRTLMNYAAEAVRLEGFAVWNIEYRGVDEKGGGYPGTFMDVALAADALRDNAERLNLQLGQHHCFWPFSRRAFGIVVGGAQKHFAIKSALAT